MPVTKRMRGAHEPQLPALPREGEPCGCWGCQTVEEPAECWGCGAPTFAIDVLCSACSDRVVDEDDGELQ